MANEDLSRSIRPTAGRQFSTIQDWEFVDGILDQRTRSDVCTGFRTFVGSRIARVLHGADAERLSAAGLSPRVYLAIRWWCLLFIPIIPLDAYALASYKQIDRPFSEDHWRGTPVAISWGLVLWQASVVAISVVALIALIVLIIVL